MVCRRPPERTSAPCRAVQSRAPRSGLTPDYVTLIRIAASLDDASTTREAEVASTLTLLPKQRERESTGGCQVLRFAALIDEAQWRPRLAFPDSQALSKPHIPTGPSVGSDCGMLPRPLEPGRPRHPLVGGMDERPRSRGRRRIRLKNDGPRRPHPLRTTDQGIRRIGSHRRDHHHDHRDLDRHPPSSLA